MEKRYFAIKGPHPELLKSSSDLSKGEVKGPQTQKTFNFITFNLITL